jgi:hypothetical protein
MRAISSPAGFNLLGLKPVLVNGILPEINSLQPRFIPFLSNIKLCEAAYNSPEKVRN